MFIIDTNGINTCSSIYPRLHPFEVPDGCLQIQKRLDFLSTLKAIHYQTSPRQFWSVKHKHHKQRKNSSILDSLRVTLGILIYEVKHTRRMIDEPSRSRYFSRSTQALARSFGWARRHLKCARSHKVREARNVSMDEDDDQRVQKWRGMETGAYHKVPPRCLLAKAG